MSCGVIVVFLLLVSPDYLLLLLHHLLRGLLLDSKFIQRLIIIGLILIIL